MTKRPSRPSASLGNLFREARPATPQRQNDGSEREGGCRRNSGRRPENCFGKPDGPQRQNNGAHASDGAGLPWAVAEASAVARKVVSGSPTGQLPAPKLRKRARATESFFGKPDGPAPSAKITEASASDGKFFRAARRARPKPKPSMILRVTKTGTRRARAGFLRTLNPKRF